MPETIGVLLPRSGEYPTMALDLLDGLRLHLKQLNTDVRLVTENIGFGEVIENTQAAAEKLIMEHDPKLLIAYSTSINAEALYSQAQAFNKPFLFLDAGMEVFEAPPHPLCRHLTLQGLQACRMLGDRASRNQEKILTATSFFDGGYRGTWAFHDTIMKNGGSIVGHYVSHYLPAEFSLAQYVQIAQEQAPQAVTAAFSSYFVELFFTHLAKTEADVRRLPVYCSPFMADEQLLPKIDFPDATLHAIAPWSVNLELPVNKNFVATIQKEKNKSANIFHLLGWEAAAAAAKMLEANDIAALDGWSIESPRGTVTFDKETHNAYAPLYEGKIVAGENGKCRFAVESVFEVPVEEHRALHFSRLDGAFSRWKNNFFCI